jgi:hypothetical protein
MSRGSQKEGEIRNSDTQRSGFEESRAGRPEAQIIWSEIQKQRGRQAESEVGRVSGPRSSRARQKYVQ